MRTVSAREANQQFSKLLEAAVGGEEVTITRHGVPVAKLVPVPRRAPPTRRASARRRAAIAWLRVRSAARAGTLDDWTRDELYDRDADALMRLTLDSNILIYALFRRRPSPCTCASTWSTARSRGRLRPDAAELRRVLPTCWCASTASTPAAAAATGRAASRPLFAVDRCRRPIGSIVAMERRSQASTVVLGRDALGDGAKPQVAGLILSEDGHDGRDLDGVMLVNPFKTDQ